MKVVLDTNVVLSALLFKGPASALHTYWQEGTIRPVASKEMFSEYARVLAYEKFRLSADEITGLLDEEIFPYFSALRTKTKRVPHVPDDPSDTMFLIAALDANARALVTGDAHLLALAGKYRFPIQSPADFLKAFPAR